jgi:acyl-CoA reductase-like NAD-dependent aldehyde dehydrogenase
MDTITRVSMTIGGAPVAADESFEVVNPATEQVWAQAPAASASTVDQAFTAAAEAAPAWARDDAARRQAVGAVADVLARHSGELAALLTAEVGKTLNDSQLEIQGAAAWFSYYAGLDVAWREAIDPGRVTGVRHPLGVVAAITPWNFPLALASWKLAPALRAGNTVVLKPSPYTPMATLRLGELLQSVFPAGVLNVVAGGDDTGAEMTRHPLAAKVSFTGSIEAGKAVAAAVAPDLKRLTLELGGNDPAIVLDDADVAATAQGLFTGGFYNNGQVCGAVKRVYVPEKLYGALAAELARIADSMVVGDGTDAATQLGPVQNVSQFDRVRKLLDAALNDGAKAVAGGERVGDHGYFLRPTIVTDAHAGQPIVDEEQFGPVLPLIPYTDLADAIRQANDTHFGLGASVWGANSGRLEEVALQIESGTVYFNGHALNYGPHVPFAGRKWSGIGTENGLEGLLSFTHLQMLYGDVAI